jgi:hypothetical protein
MTAAPLMRATFAQVVVALARDDFEICLIEGDALAIFDLRYKPGHRLREPNALLRKYVFDNAERIENWLEEWNQPKPLISFVSDKGNDR